MKLTGRTALVTGAASGLGAATARMIVEAGGKVLMVDLREPATTSDRTHFVKADVADPDSMSAAVQEALDRFGALHFAVNCAGILDPQKVVDKDGPASLERFSRVIRVNLIGTFNICRLAAAAMSKNDPDDGGERGVLVNTASIAAFDGQIGQASYSASKGGIVGMTLPMARDLARQGIRVMAIAPGLFNTPMMASLPDNVRAALGASVPFPSRLGSPEEYALLVRQIFENPMLNGEVIRLDGAVRLPPR